MKKNYLKKEIALLLTATMTVAIIGCNKTTEVSVSEDTVEEVSLEETPVEDASSEEEIVGMINPMEVVDYEKICEVTGCEVFLPKDMENPMYYLISNELGEVRYTTDSGYYSMSLRVQKADEFTDISGLYYDWEYITDGLVWDYNCTEMGVTDSENACDIHVLLWYNQYSKIMYCLSSQAISLNSIDLVTIAMNMMMPEETNDTVEQKEYESYDEIIGLLNENEAYSLVNVKGYDGKVLLVSSGTFDNGDGKTMAAIDAVVYTMKSNGTVTSDMELSSPGTAYPLSIDKDGLLYCYGPDSVQKLCYGENGTSDVAIMIMTYISVIEDDEEGRPSKVSGFYRNPSITSIIDNDSTEYAEDDIDAFDKAFKDFENANVINFTTIK